MKKMRWGLALLALVLVAVAGCGMLAKELVSQVSNKAERIFQENPSGTHLYYLNQEEDQIQAVAYDFTVPDTSGRVLELIAQQTKDPQRKNLVHLLPAGCAIEKSDLQSRVITLDLSGPFRKAPMTRQILALGGLVRTFTQLEDVDQLRITVDGKPLTDAAGKEIGALTEADFVENAGKNINTYQEVTMTLYFADETGTKLYEEKRPVYYSSSEPLEKAVVEELIRGPKQSGHYPVLAADTILLGVVSQNNVCYVNLQDTVRTNATLSVSERTQVYAIVNSLSATCKSEKVQFTIDGKSSGAFRDKLDLGVQYQPDLSLVAAVG